MNRNIEDLYNSVDFQSIDNDSDSDALVENVFLADRTSLCAPNHSCVSFERSADKIGTVEVRVNDWR